MYFLAVFYKSSKLDIVADKLLFDCGRFASSTPDDLFFFFVLFTPCWQITVLQLSTLLKQADSSKRKLTLTRLASAPVPFTVLSLTGNPCNEDYLAVCGLKVRKLDLFFPTQSYPKS